MIEVVALFVLVVLARILVRSGRGKGPLSRDELRRMRSYYERAHREEVLPFD